MRAKVDDGTLEWLMDGPPWVRFRAKVDLLGEDPEGSKEEWALVASDPQVLSLVHQVTTWPWPRLNSHKSAAHPIHKLAFIADLGFDVGMPVLGRLAERLMSQASDEGPFYVTANVGKHYGGTGRDTLAWALCDAPLIAYSLVHLGAAEDDRVRRAVAHLVGLVRENGWPCAVSRELGRFRGPGRRDDPCPYANLAMLKLLASVPSLRDGREARIGAETLLRLWAGSREEHPYMFFMGTDFRKLKVPFVWYDIMHVADVLTRFPWALEDERLRDMASLIRDKADGQGRYVPESIWSDWKGWEFGQKKQPSRWLTLTAYRTLARLDLA